MEVKILSDRPAFIDEETEEIEEHDVNPRASGGVPAVGKWRWVKQGTGLP